MSKGRLTDEVEALARKLLGQDINQRELRLLPYVKECLLNGTDIDHTKLNAEEEAILELWQAAGWVTDPYHDLVIEPEFEESMHTILKLAY